MRESRRALTDPRVLDALAHPVRLDVLNHLMSAGPATASACARAVGDTPSNCSYHARVLAQLGLVEEDRSSDGRERPWRATVTGLTLPDGDANATGQAASSAALNAAALQLDQRLARDYLAGRDQVPPRWRRADAYSTYTLRATPAELRDLTQRIDALVRPLIAATREASPQGSELVHLGLHAFPRPAPR